MILSEKYIETIKAIIAEKGALETVKELLNDELISRNGTRLHMYPETLYMTAFMAETAYAITKAIDERIMFSVKYLAHEMVQSNPDMPEVALQVAKRVKDNLIKMACDDILPQDLNELDPHDLIK
jgi:hypothetical protein